jgi:hypothetical protein
MNSLSYVTVTRIFVNKSEEEFRESLKFKILYLFLQCTQDGRISCHLLGRKACKTRLVREIIILICFVPSNIQIRDSPQSRTKMREFMAGNHYESPQHKLLNTAVIHAF